MEGRRSEILAAVKAHLVAQGIEEERVIPEAELGAGVGLDSLDTVSLVVAMEERFDIEIPDSDLQNVETVGDAVTLIESKLAVGA